ncbi:MAG: glycosyltransferase [Verrucomicrobiota bacterium]
MTSVALLIHGGPNSIEAIRARGLAQNHPPDRVHFLYREEPRGETARLWKRRLADLRPDLLYVVNTALPGAWLAPWLRLTKGIPYILDTGDAVFAMAQSAGHVPAWRLPLLKLGESFAHQHAEVIVVRGTRHLEHLQARGARNVLLIRDGVDLNRPAPAETVEALRRKLGLENSFVVGVMGSLTFSPRLGICYGWDLVEAMPSLKDLPIRAVIIGDGDGRPRLERRAAELGVADRVTFCGRIPYDEVPVYLRLLDVALSTQTNNLAGQVRTTGKLPEYMAAGCFILASRVGEAEILLPPSMLLDYSGDVDPFYPQRLADRLRHLHTHPADLAPRESLPALAEKHCSYPALSRLFDRIIQTAANLP